MGRNGKTYERLDQPTIMQWFESYAQERLTIAEDVSLSKHEQHTHGEKERKYDGYIAKLHADLQNTEQTKIKNIAYAMAKKMNANSVIRSDSTVAQLQAADPKKSTKNKSKEK